MAKVCDDYFIDSLEIITRRLKISEDVAGASFMAIGSSAPELFIALIALTKPGQESIGVGTIVGSAIFNVLVIIGASAWVAKTLLDWKPLLRDIMFYIISLLVLLLTFYDGEITYPEVFIYIAIYVIYLLVLKRWKKWVPTEISKREKIEKPDKINKIKTYHKYAKPLNFSFIQKYSKKILDLTFPDLKKNENLYLLSFGISIAWIAILSWAMVEIGIDMAHHLGIPSAIIGLTILAAGTSIPDLLSSVIASRRGMGNMALSNAIGSNTFDILIGLGVPWLLFIWLSGDIVRVETESLITSVLLLFSTVILLGVILVAKKFVLDRKVGFFFILIYAIYLSYEIIKAVSPDLLF
jgi:K+-dependent Na+/Ca+ exchanger-like protein